MTNKTNKSFNTNKQNKVQGAMDIFTGHIWTLIYGTLLQ